MPTWLQPTVITLVIVGLVWCYLVIGIRMFKSARAEGKNIPTCLAAAIFGPILLALSAG